MNDLNSVLLEGEIVAANPDFGVCEFQLVSKRHNILNEDFFDVVRIDVRCYGEVAGKVDELLDLDKRNKVRVVGRLDYDVFEKNFSLIDDHIEFQERGYNGNKQKPSA